MYRCEAPNCKMRTFFLTKEQSKLAKNNYVVSFHKFPDDEKKRKAWIDAAHADEWSPPDYSCLCSLHFQDDCFNSKNQLYDYAIPTIFFGDFKSHIKAIVKGFNLDCGLSDNDNDSDSQSEEHEVAEMQNKNASVVPVDNMDLLEILEDDEQEFSNTAIPEVEEKPDVIEVTSNIVVSDIEDLDYISCEEIDISDETVEEKANVSQPGRSRNSPPNSLASSSQPTKSKLVTGTSGSKPNTCSSREFDTGVKRRHSLTPSVPSKRAKPVSATEIETTIKPTEKNMQPQQHDQELPKIQSPAELFSMIQTGSLDKRSMVTPASRSLILQLLNIVKLANCQGDSKSANSTAVPSTYIITTKQEEEAGQPKCETVLMETSEIVLLVNDIVKTIKNGVRPNQCNMNIICTSPGIFLLKYISVKNCDPSMNSVYVITSENLLPYLNKLEGQIAADSSQQNPAGVSRIQPEGVKGSTPRTLKPSGAHISGTAISQPSPSISLIRKTKSELQVICKNNSPIASTVKSVSHTVPSVSTTGVSSTRIQNPTLPALVSCASNFSSLSCTTNEVSEFPKTEDTDSEEVKFDSEVYYQQVIQIEDLEKSILERESEISALRKKLEVLKKRYNAVKIPSGSRTDEQIVEDILSKYIDSDGVQFFVGQMKVSGKTYTQFRWNTEDKLCALRLLYKNPGEYNILFENYTLPSDKTLSKFVSKIKKAEMEEEDL